MRRVLHQIQSNLMDFEMAHIRSSDVSIGGGEMCVYPGEATKAQILSIIEEYGSVISCDETIESGRSHYLIQFAI